MSDDEKSQDSQQRSFRSKLQKNPQRDSKIDDKEQKELLRKKREEIKEIDKSLKSKSSQGQLKLAQFYETAKSEISQSQSMSSIQSVKSELIPKIKEKRQLAKVTQSLKSGNFKNEEDVKLALKYQKNQNIVPIKITRDEDKVYQELFDLINYITDREFETGGRHLVFNKINNLIKGNNQYIIIHIQDVKYTKVNDLLVNSDLELKQPINPPLYFWEVQHNRSPLFCSSKKNFDNIQFECLDFMYRNNYLDPLEIILWKSQNNKNSYVGQFTIDIAEFEQLEDVKTFDRRTLRAKQPNKVNLVRKQQDDRKILGEIKIKYKIIQYTEKVEPQNNISNVRGSPRQGDLNERMRRKLVERAKELGEYQWKLDQDAKAQVIVIDDINKDYVEIVTVEQAKNFINDLYQDGVMNLLSGDDYKLGDQIIVRKFAVSRRVPKSEALQNILKSLEEDPKLQIMEGLRSSIRKGRISKEDLTKALETLGASPTEIFALSTNSFGGCLMDDLFGGINLGLAIDLIPQMNLEKQENAEALEIVAEKFFQNLKDALKQRDSLEGVVKLMDTIQDKPEFALIIAQFADQYQHSRPQNNNQDVPIVFLEHFDINKNHPNKMDNYEHIMLLGKIRKLAKKYLDQDSLFLKDLDKAYNDAKTSLYFVVPILPKNVLDRFEEKKHLLVLGEEAPSATSQDMKVEFKQVKKNIKGKELLVMEKKLVPKSEEEQNLEKLLPPPCMFNIFHENVRRKRWNNLYKGFSAAPDYFYQKDSTDRSTFSALIEEAPFDVIMSFLVDFLPKNKEAEEEPVELMEGQRPKQYIDPKKLIAATNNKQDKNILHSIAANPIPVPSAQLKCLKQLNGILTPEDALVFQNQPIKGQEIIPLCQYINTLASIKNKIAPKDQEFISEIVQELSNKVSKEFDYYAFHAYFSSQRNNLEVQKIEEELKSSYINNVVQIARALTKFDDRSYDIIGEQINWINWFGMSFDSLARQDAQFLLFNLARNGSFKKLGNILQNFRDQVLKKLPKVIQQKDDFALDHSNNLFVSSEDQDEKDDDKKAKGFVLRGFKQEEIQPQKFENKLVEIQAFDNVDQRDEFLKKFYEKYPLDALVGLVEIFEESQFKQVPILQLVIQLIQDIISEEPRALAQCLSLKNHKINPFQTVKSILKKYSKKDISELIPKYHLFMLDPQEQSQLEQIDKDPIQIIRNLNKPQMFDQLIKRNEIPQLLNKIAEFSQLKDYLQDGEENQQDRLPELLQASSKILKRILNNQAKLGNQIKFSQISNIVKNCPQICSKNLLRTPLIDAFSNPKNTVLMNQLLQTLGNPALQNLKLIQKPSTCLLSQENYLKSLETHYAIGLNLAQFKQLLQDTADMTNSSDIAGMSFILAKNGLPDKLALVINKIDQGDVLLSMARQGILQQAKLLRIYSKKEEAQQGKYKGQPKDKYIPEAFEKMNSIKQNLIVLDEDKKRKFNQLPEFKKIQRPYNLQTKQRYIKSLWDSQGDKKVAQEIYESNLRRTFLTQNVRSGFNRWKTEDKQNYEEALKLVIGAIKNDKIEEVRLKFKESDPLFVEKITKKAYLLPISQDNYDLIFLSLNPKVTILKAADAIVQYHLRIHPSEAIRNDKKTRQGRCLAFLTKHFKKDLVEVFNIETHKPKLFRILRSIDFTLKKSQDDYNLMFATQCALIITKNFEQQDFQNIIKNHDQFYNSIAVAMMRSRTRNMDAIKFISQQVDKQEFFDLVCEVEDKKTLNSRSRIDIYPVKIEIEPAIILVPLAINNVDYITFLLKNKIRPFFKSYQLEKGIPTIPILNNQPITELNILQQLIYRNHEILVKQQLWNELKPKGKLQGNEDWQWLMVGIASGNQNLLELIIKDVLQLNADLFFDQIIRSDQGILNKLLLYFNEDQVVKFLNTFMFPYECKQDPKNYQFITISFETMIVKKYVKYWRFITKFILENIADNDINKYKETLLKFAETQINSTSQSDHEMTYLEYSISEGFLDIGMMLGDLKLAQNPFGQEQMEIYGKFQNIGFELAQSEAILQKSKDPLKSKYFQFYLSYSKFMKNQGLAEINQTRSFIMLIEIARKYCDDSQFYFQLGKFNEILILTFAGIQNHQYYIEYFDEFISDEALMKSIHKNEMEFLFILHLNGFDKVLKYRQSIVDYINTQSNQTFWSNKQIQELLLKQFKIDIINIKTQMSVPELYSIDKLYNFGGPIIKQYILMNQPIINLNPQLADEQTDYKKLPIIKAQELIIQIRSQSIENPNFEGLVLSLKNFMNELDSNGSLFRALLAVAIVDFVVHVDEIMEIINADINSPIHPVTQLFQFGVGRFGLQQMSVQINLLLQGLKTNNKVYLALMKYPLAREIKITNRQGTETKDIHPLSKDLIKEKHMVTGLSEFLRQYTKREKFNIIISDKEINKCLSFDNSKQNPLCSDKIYKGFMVIKFFLDLAFELDQLYNDIQNSQYDFEIQTQAFNMREIAKQSVTLNKVIEVKNEQKELQYYKFLLTVPILITDYEGSCYMIIPLNIMKQIKALQDKHLFDSIQFKELLGSAVQQSKEIGSIQALLSLNPQNINADNHMIISQNIDDMFGLAKEYQIQEFTIIDLIQGIDEISNYKKRLILTLEQEINHDAYTNYEYNLEVKAVLCTKDQYNDKNAINKLLKKLIDDFILTARQIEFQKQESEKKQQDQDDQGEKKKTTRDLEWPFYLYQDQVISNHQIYPLYMYFDICFAIDNYFKALNYRINYLSIIDSYLIKWASMLDIQAKGQVVSIQKLISTAFQWPLFGYILNETYQLSKQYFQNDQIIFEFSDTFKQANNKGLFFSGFDQIVRFGCNNYFYHKGNLIIRINIIFIRNDLSPLEELIKNKQKPKQPVGDIQLYIDSIINKQDLMSTLEFIANK